MESQFSSYDLNLAQQNPNVGLSLLNYKQQYKNATTDAERAAANAGANALRSQFGYYTGGPSGSQWIPTSQMTPYTSQIQPLLDQSLNYPEFSYGSAPSYNSRWDSTLVDQLRQINNYPKFDQDITQSDLYQNYRQQAIREADRSYQDAIGAATALTNGQMSSGAMAAASQARDYQMSKINDQYTNIYNTLYRQYTNEFNMLLEKFASTGKLEDMDYNKFLNELQQYNIDRDFAYQDYINQFNMIQSNLGNVTGLDQSAWERNYTTGQTNFENQMALGRLGAEFMDYSGLNALGIDTSAYEAAVRGSGGGSYGGGGGSYRGTGGTGTGGKSGKGIETATFKRLISEIQRQLALGNAKEAQRIYDHYWDLLSEEQQKELNSQVG